MHNGTIIISKRIKQLQFDIYITYLIICDSVIWQYAQKKSSIVPKFALQRAGEAAAKQRQDKRS